MSARQTFLGCMKFQGKYVECIEEIICNGLETVGFDFNNRRAICLTMHVSLIENTGVQRRQCEKNGK